MKAFEYAAPTTVDDAVKLLGAPNSAALAGGTDLLGRMKDYVTSPDRVVYLKDIKELAGISGDPKAGGLTDRRRDPALRHRRRTPASASRTRRSGRRPSRSARRRSAT